ncbi:hypothetical protein [Sphingomonas sp. R1]|uniref:hypothetical protein n=1 Tax=Sphingomonas sp. R1 TaxID=399176 RepID=UPI002225771B|nr:hypothetical protein [Sphingomonas sp. R1]UYY76965.1 hypothetical protein OIM94_15915 [Sphingomonas sp. R1]
MPHKAQSHPFHAAGMEAVEEGKDANASAAKLWRQSRVPCHRCDIVSLLYSLFLATESKLRCRCTKTSGRLGDYLAIKMSMCKTTRIAHTHTASPKLFLRRAAPRAEQQKARRAMYADGLFDGGRGKD